MIINPHVLYMKKVLIVVFVLLQEICVFEYVLLSQVAGFGAKALCSCAYLGGERKERLLKRSRAPFLCL